MSINTTISEKAADLLLSINGVTFRFNPPYKFTSGIKSPVYLDNRLVMSYPDVRKKIIALYVKAVKENIGLENVDYISATATAAIPQGAWIAEALNLPMIFVRPTTKTYGKGNKMEGYLKKGSNVLIIEDHISTAASVIGNVETVRENGGKVKYCIATTSYETEQSKKGFADLKVKLFALTNGKTIIKQALKRKVISEDQKKEVDRWFKDPAHWSPNL